MQKRVSDIKKKVRMNSLAAFPLFLKYTYKIYLFYFLMINISYVKFSATLCQKSRRTLKIFKFKAHC